VVRDRLGHVLATKNVDVSVPPATSVRAVTSDLQVRPTHSVADIVLVKLGRVVWTPLGSYVPPGLQVEGAGVSNSRRGDVTIVASISNRGSRQESGTLVCVAEDTAGGMTGVATTTVSLRPRRASAVAVPLPRSVGRSRHAECEIDPEGR
jgi:hypothetical protein